MHSGKNLECIYKPSHTRTLTGLDSGTSSSTAAPPDALMLHIDSSTNKMSLRSCDGAAVASASPSSLKPCELKFSPCISNLIRLTCRRES